MLGTRIPSGASASWSLDSRMTSWAVGGSGGRGGRRNTKRDPSSRSSRKEKFEPPPSPIRSARRRPAPRPCSSRNLRTLSRISSGGLSTMSMRRSCHHPTVQTLLGGGAFFESPRWHDGRWWFSDFFRRVVLAVDADGVVEEILRVEAQPSGLGWLPDGSLLVVSMRDRRVLRRARCGTVSLHADL